MSEEKASYEYDPRPRERQNIHVNKKINVPSVNDLEQLSTHELADLLSQVVLLLRRMPDIPMAEITTGQPGAAPPERIRGATGLLDGLRKEKPGQTTMMPDWLE